jgi:hypothetical protein
MIPIRRAVGTTIGDNITKPVPRQNPIMVDPVTLITRSPKSRLELYVFLYSRSPRLMAPQTPPIVIAATMYLSCGAISTCFLLEQNLWGNRRRFESTGRIEFFEGVYGRESVILRWNNILILLLHYDNNNRIHKSIFILTNHGYSF